MIRRSSALLVTEAALGLVTVAAIIGMHRLFTDGSYRPALLVQALVAHVTMALLRRRGLSLPVSAVIAVVVAVFSLTWGFYAETTTAFLPSGATWQAVGEDLDAAWALFKDVRAPAPPETGFLLAASVALWVMVYVADWAAFRASATFEALLPSATLFLFAAALGAPGGRVAGAMAYAAAAMLFVLLRRTLDQERSSAWAASHRTRGRWSLLGTGTALTVVAVVAGAIAGPKLPGADADPLIAWRDMGDDDAPRVVVSPMVNIQARLVEQSDQELFTVRSPVESYWRLTSLDEFDGQIWKSSYGTSDADGELPHAVDPQLQVDEVTQAVRISALAEVWLPAAFEPLAIDAGDGAVDWDERSSTLIVDRDVPTSDGLEYQVVSTVPNWTEEELRSATDEVPDEIRDRYTALPDSLAPEVRQLAAQLTANAQTPYDRALALQTHLRTFQYDLTAPRGHSADALSAFLFETRRGYCEQFAGSFAALAREVGLPARVAVGFTSGVRDESDPELYRVSGEHAHAWVEVYLDPYGWVPFDPTPGRAPPRSERWLGVTPDQEDADPTGGAGAGAETPATVPPPQSSGDTPASRPQQDDNGIATGGIDPDDGGGGGVGGAVRVVSRGLGAIGLAYLLLVPVALLLAAALRRRRATTPGGRVRLAWQDALAAAERARVRIPPSNTVSEAAAELSDAFPPVTPAVYHLAGLLERATYAEVEPSPEEADVAVRAGREVVAAARRSMPWHWRLLRWVDVRELWRRRAAHHRRSAAAGVQAPRPLVGAR